MSTATDRSLAFRIRPSLAQIALPETRRRVRALNEPERLAPGLGGLPTVIWMARPLRPSARIMGPRLHEARRRCMIEDVNGLAFASSLITSALWPIVVVVIVITFRKPLAALISRTRRYEGLGQKVEFGPALAEAENSVGKAAQDIPGTERQAEVEPNPLVREAQANPSYVVIQSWEQLSSAIADVAGTVFPDRKVAAWNATRALPELRQLEVVNQDFVTSVNRLRDLRNQVAHGESNPTPGEAVAYVESAQLLTLIAHNIAFLLANPPLTSAD